MTVTNTDQKDIYSGDAVTLIFAYTFRILQASNLVITITDTLGVNPVIDMVLNSDYTVDNVGNPAGGDVTLLLTGQISTAPLATDTITILREVPLTQNLDLIENDDFPSQSQEDAFDKLTFIDQQQQEQLGRSVTIPASVTGVSVALPVPVADFLLGWNASATALINLDPNVVGAANVIASAASAAAALASEVAAASSASAAASSASAAATSETNSGLNVGYAEEWANKAEDSLVSAAAGGDLVDDFSALHWANKASASAASTGLPTVAFPGDEGKILVARAAASPDAYALEASVPITLDNFTIINPGGITQTAPFILDNIMLNAMNIASNNDLSVGNLVDGVVDTYTDETGIDNGASANETFEGGSYRTQTGTLAAETKLILNFDSAYTGAKEIIDFGGNDHIVTQFGNATLSPLHFKFGDGALCFNGIDQYLTVPASADWDIFASNSDNWTVDFWTKFNDLDDPLVKFVITQGNDANNTWRIDHVFNSGWEWKFRVGGVNQIETTEGGQIDDSEWHHIAFIKVADVYSTWVDGIQVNYVQDATTNTTPGTLKIGVDATELLFFNGYLDEVRIINEDPFGGVAVPSPAVHFRLNDNAANTTIRNNVVGGSNGTFDGGPDTEQVTEGGKVSRNTLDFNGIDERCSVSGIVAGIATDTSGTISFWVNPDSGASGTIFSVSRTAANSQTIQIRYSGGGNDWVSLFCQVNAGADELNIHCASGLVPDNGTWTHVAITQTGTQANFVINGVLDTNVVRTLENVPGAWLSLLTGPDNARIACENQNGLGNAGFFDGRLEDLRIYSNVVLTETQILKIRDDGITGVYGMGSPNITVPVAAHTSDADTHLLMHFDSATQGNDLIDSSTGGAGSPHTITSVAGAGVTGKFGNASYFGDGTSGTYLTVPSSTDWDDIFNSLATSHTLDTWFRSITIDEQIMSQQVDSSNRFSWSTLANGRIQFRMIVGGVQDVFLEAPPGTISVDNEWHHMAAIKVNADWALYLDGVRVASDVQTLTPSYGVELIIGADGNGGGGSPPFGSWWNGFIDDLRIQADNAIFSADPTTANPITVPTVAAVATGATSLLLGFNTQDESPFNHIPTFFGSAAITNAVVQTGFGTGSLDFNGSTDYLTLPDSDSWDIVADPKEDWTIDFLIKFTDHIPTETIFNHGTPSTDRWIIRHVDTVGWQFRVDIASITVLNLVGGGEISDTNWHHIAVIKKGSEIEAGAEYGIYVDGTQVVYSQSNILGRFDGPLFIGATVTPSSFFDGQMDGIRIAQTNTIFSANPNNVPDDTIVVPTSSPAAIGSSAPDLLLQSTAAAVTGAAPDTLKTYIDLEDIDPVVLVGMDITLEVSRDGGTTFTTAANLAQTGQAVAGRRLLEAQTDVSAQPDPGVDLATIVYRIRSANEVQFRLHANTRVWG